MIGNGAALTQPTSEGSISQALQRRRKAFQLGFKLGLAFLRFFDCLFLGALHEVRIGELCVHLAEIGVRAFNRFFEALAFRRHVDDASQRQCRCRLAGHDQSRLLRRGFGK